MKAQKKASKTGRKPVYDTKIAPNLETIRILAQSGISQVKIRGLLGVSRNTWEKYKGEKKDFLDAVSAQKQIDPKDHAEQVKELEKTMYKIALGYDVEREDIIRTKDGAKVVTRTEHIPPSFNALRFLLLNWGGYLSEPALQNLREREFEHKQEQDKKDDW